jgi:hypothetical protein
MADVLLPRKRMWEEEKEENSRVVVALEAKEWRPDLRVVCGFQRLETELRQQADEDERCRMPGVVRTVDFPECVKVEEVGKCVVWNKTLYCGTECAEFSRQYEQQMKKLEAAQQSMTKLKPGNWQSVGNNSGWSCRRCHCTRIVAQRQSLRRAVALLTTVAIEQGGVRTEEEEEEEDDLTLYRNTELVHDSGWVTSGGVCALCAQVFAQYQLLSLDLGLDLVHQTFYGREGLVDKLPEGLALAPGDRFGVLNTCQEGTSANCLGMGWSGPLVFWNGTKKTAQVCVFCADEENATERQRTWDKAARATLLGLVESGSGSMLLPVDVVDGVIGQYHLGRYFDLLAIFGPP